MRYIGVLTRKAVMEIIHQIILLVEFDCLYNQNGESNLMWPDLRLM